MAGERKFIRENTNRILIKDFLVSEIKGAGFGGMTIQRTPMGTRINILVERPGMVIGKGGSKIKSLTEAIKDNFNVDNPQIEIEDAAGKAPLNAQIMAEKLAEALQRGWHFRRAGHSTVRRIMYAGAKGCQIIIAGKLTGARHRTEKFTQGHVKYCGETAKEVMDRGFAIAKLKAGVLGVKVGIMKPDAKLPDEIKISIPKTTDSETPDEKKADAETKKKITQIKKLAEIPGVGPSVVKKFEKAGFGSIEELYEMDVKELSAVNGVGKKTAENVVKNLRKLLKEVD
ncbi:MAG: 30S ribosomal protein S3 [Candidatus Thermoplasmatota archaeon]|nr:30S ribosomal protein S3 [Candidatus Thermoplasmatota archaeon]